MKPVLELMTFTGKDGKDFTGVSIGIKIKIGGNENVHPIIRVCDSLDALKSEIRVLNENIENLLDKAEMIFNGSSQSVAVDIQPDMGREEIWELLSSITDEKVFIEGFNNLHETKRREVADYALTKCNIFSGKGALFSSRYNNESGLLE